MAVLAAFAALALAAAPAPAPATGNDALLPTGADAVMALVQRCLAQKLDPAATLPPLRGAPVVPDPHKPDFRGFSADAVVIPTLSGWVVADHDKNYCSAYARDVDPGEIDRRLQAALNTAPFTTSRNPQPDWRDGKRVMRQVDFFIDSETKGDRVPIVVLQYMQGDDGWLDANIGEATLLKDYPPPGVP